MSEIVPSALAFAVMPMFLSRVWFSSEMVDGVGAGVGVAAGV
jgi:hypothetical protein